MNLRKNLEENYNLNELIKTEKSIKETVKSNNHKLDGGGW